jgi:hypothetical protein
MICTDVEEALDLEEQVHLGHTLVEVEEDFPDAGTLDFMEHHITGIQQLRKRKN